MKYGICTLEDFSFSGKTVLCRVDINSPVDRVRNQLTDITRIEGCIPTIQELADQGSKVVLLAHQGGDLEYQNYVSTEIHGPVLASLLKSREVLFVDDVCGPTARAKIGALANGEILLLDNVRYVAEELTLFEMKLKLSPQEQANTLIVRKLAPLADFYVCDAFAAIHRSQPSLVGFEEVLPSAMGRLFEAEYSALSRVMREPEHPCLFILGGTKIQDAFLMMSSVLDAGIADGILATGLVGNILLWAKGIDIGQPSRDFITTNQLTEYVERGKEILRKHESRIRLPVDLGYVDEGRRECEVAELPLQQLFVDIGHQTVKQYLEQIGQAKTIFINGPAGVFEQSDSEYGTQSLWQAVVHSSAYSVIGGGDSIAAAKKYQVKPKFSYVCTGGGAMIRFLAGEPLPVIEALQKAGKRFLANNQGSG
jgi:phosphoglycerate kinase